MIEDKGGIALENKIFTSESLEFQRAVNLSDAVFAIAMTLLVLSTDIPDVPSYMLGEALAAQAAQFAALLLSFSLVAMIWWQHHSHMAMLKKIDPFMIGFNMAFLGVVILVPYPTNLIGNDPRASIAVLFFISTFILLNLTFMMIIIRAYQIEAFMKPINKQGFIWELSGWILGIFILTTAMVISIWYPPGKSDHIICYYHSQSGNQLSFQPVQLVFLKWKRVN